MLAGLSAGGTAPRAPCRPRTLRQPQRRRAAAPRGAAVAMPTARHPAPPAPAPPPALPSPAPPGRAPPRSWRPPAPSCRRPPAGRLSAPPRWRPPPARLLSAAEAAAAAPLCPPGSGPSSSRRRLLSGATGAPAARSRPWSHGEPGRRHRRRRHHLRAGRRDMPARRRSRRPPVRERGRCGRRGAAPRSARPPAGRRYRESAGLAAGNGARLGTGDGGESARLGTRGGWEGARWGAALCRSAAPLNQAVFCRCSPAATVGTRGTGLRPGVRSALQHLEWDGGMEQRQIAHHLSSADKAAEIRCPQESSGSAITLRFVSTIHSRSVFPPSHVTSRGCKLALSALCFPKATLKSSPFLSLSY